METLNRVHRVTLFIFLKLVNSMGYNQLHEFQQRVTFRNLHLEINAADRDLLSSNFTLCSHDDEGL